MLKLQNIHKTFNPGTVNEKPALCGVDLDLAAGDFTPGFRIQNGLQVRAAAGDQNRDVQHSSTPSPSAISPRM